VTLKQQNTELRRQLWEQQRLIHQLTGQVRCPPFGDL
jgi:hypothetical protein